MASCPLDRVGPLYHAVPRQRADRHGETAWPIIKGPACDHASLLSPITARTSSETAGPMRTNLATLGTLLAILLCCGTARAEITAQEFAATDFFESRIRPLLVAKCFGCHADEERGGLRLDSRAAIIRGGDSGPAIQLEEHADSLLLLAVNYSDEDLQMPPSGKLTEEQIADLAKWVSIGATWPEPDAGRTLLEGTSITSRQLGFWSLQPLAKPPLPTVDDPRWSRNPIDRFVHRQHRERQLEPAPRADRRTLLRRGYYDLIGLPPSPEAVQAFVEDESPDPFGSAVEELLASQHYGERWGRHWLDVVRYSDTAGDASDYPVPEAYQYRDYVIRAFNSDKPYDAFLHEQLAGDLLESQTDDERWERIVATGYLAGARRFGVAPRRSMHLTMADVIENFGQAFLGLSIGCARCHDHKYDPIPQSDYYALYGIFQSTKFPFPGSEKKHKPDSFVYRLPQDEVDAIIKPYYGRVDPLKRRLGRVEGEKRKFVKGVSERSLEEILAEIEDLHRRLDPLLAEKPNVDVAYAVREGTPADAEIHERGEPDNKGDTVVRGFVQVLGGQQLQDPQSSGRLELANWLTDPSNPLTSRVIVNRIWQYHFGQGLVSTANDFGARGRPPTHPELLDYLARRLIESGWSIKELHRLIMDSETYQLAAVEHPANAASDVGNRYLWRANRQRLDAESIRDAMLWISGDLATDPDGEHPFPHVALWDYMQHGPFTAVYESNHRSVYLMTQRIQRHPYLAMFDGADPSISVAGREATVTPIQSLFSMNSRFVTERAEHWARRLRNSFEMTDDQLARAYQDAFARPATKPELQRARAYLAAAQARLKSSDDSPDAGSLQPMASFLKVLLGSNEFLFID